MNEMIVSFVVAAIFTLILKDFFDFFLLNKFSSKIVRFLIWLVYFVIDIIASSNLKITGLINIIYSFILLMVFCVVLYQDNIKHILLTVSFILCIGTVSELIVSFCIRAFYDFSHLEQYSLFGSMCSKLIILIIIRIIKFFQICQIKKLDYVHWLASISITASSLYIVYNLYLLSLNETKFCGSITSSVLILLLNVICFKMFDKIAIDAEVRYKNDIYKQSIQIYKKEIEEREKYNKKLRHFRHDIKNHFIAIQELALTEEYERLQVYIQQITSESGIFQSCTITGNPLIDGLLNNKMEIANKYGITVQHHIEIPDELEFEDADLCIIVGNALDNAIEGTKDVSGIKKIDISMEIKQGNFIFKVKNTCNPKTINFENKGKHFLTSKADKINHGMGIGIIEETVQKYHGITEVIVRENIFILSVLLYQDLF